MGDNATWRRKVKQPAWFYCETSVKRKRSQLKRSSKHDWIVMFCFYHNHH